MGKVDSPLRHTSVAIRPYWGALGVVASDIYVLGRRLLFVF